MEPDEERRVKKEMEYTVELSDGSTVTTADVENVLNLPNSSSRRIQSIELATPYSMGKIRASVRFRNEAIIPVTYDLRGEDKEVVSLSDKLEQDLVGLRQWYSLLTIERILYVAMSSVLVLSTLALVFIVLLLAFDGMREAPRNIPVEIPLLFVLAPFVILMVLASLSWKIFPVGTFAIGQGVQRHNRLKTIRMVALTGILLPIPVGVLVNFLS